jgi:hypothetical protein
MQPTPSLAVRLCGTETTDPPSRTLVAGPLSAAFENGALRTIRIAGAEVIRAIAFLVRDENWGTFTPAIDGLAIEEDDTGFRVRYRATCADAKRKLVYSAEIVGKPDGSLAFSAVAEPVTDVETNRTGFIVLHPVDGVAGRPVKVLHTDGGEEVSTFPALIDPVQPFLDIRALSHEALPGVWVTCRMEGDAFEMEDQRNWSDASYKTYVRPLARPWPYVLKAGEALRQSVTLTVSGLLPAATAAGEMGLVVEIGGASGGTMPAIGLGVPAAEAANALAVARLVRTLGPRHLVCAFDARRDGADVLSAYRALGESAGAAVVLEAVIAGDDPAVELAALAETVRTAALPLAGLTVSPAADLRSILPGTPWPPVAPAETIAAAARAAFPGVPLGGGMLSYFTELNRKRPPAALLDYVTHTTCPIVHAADDRSVMETLEAMPSILSSTRAFIGNTPYRIGPSAIGCRQNPYGKATTANPRDERVCLAENDPRQRGLFNAAWTLTYVAACARGGVEAVAMSAPTGPFGVLHRKGEAPKPGYDGAGDALYPVFHVLAALAGLSGKPLLGTTISRSGLVDGIAVRDGGGTTLLIANLTPDEQTVRLPSPGAGATAAVLDADSVARTTGDPAALATLAAPLTGDRLTLAAYAVARVQMPAV